MVATVLACAHSFLRSSCSAPQDVKDKPVIFALHQMTVRVRAVGIQIQTHSFSSARGSARAAKGKLAGRGSVV